MKSIRWLQENENNNDIENDYTVYITITLLLLFVLSFKDMIFNQNSEITILFDILFVYIKEKKKDQYVLLTELYSIF